MIPPNSLQRMSSCLLLYQPAFCGIPVATTINFERTLHRRPPHEEMTEESRAVATYSFKTCFIDNQNSDNLGYLTQEVCWCCPGLAVKLRKCALVETR
mmetsp:Transcript_130754/g.194845  ORF Transcript_130754/g.194845 Transcript_130754/m.194845 type:complete len:98 (+) Transcript_130754:38-331(+)